VEKIIRYKKINNWKNKLRKINNKNQDLFRKINKEHRPKAETDQAVMLFYGLFLVDHSIIDSSVDGIDW